MKVSSICTREKGENSLAKTEKELQELKEEVQALEAKLSELSEEELEEVAGGCPPLDFDYWPFV